MTEGNHIKIQIHTHGLMAMKCYNKSTFRIKTYHPIVGPAWYEFCIYQDEDHLYDDSCIEASMSREQLEALRNEIDKVLEAEE